MNAEMNGTETDGLYRLNLNVGSLFELKVAVVLPGQFAGILAGMYIYMIKHPCFVILLTWNASGVKSSCRHRSKRATSIFAVTSCQTCSRTSASSCGLAVPAVTA